MWMMQELKRRQWKLWEACVLYEDLIAREKSGEEVAWCGQCNQWDQTSPPTAEEIPTRQSHCQNSGCSTWTWSTFWGNLSKQNALDTGYSIFRLFLKCFSIWYLLVTTFTPNLPSCIVLYPVVFQKAVDGFRIVRRSDQKWEGLSTDLVVEQVLMRSMKMSGGLTRGRGMTEQQWLVWLLSMPVCAEMNYAMLDLTGVSYVQYQRTK